MHSVSTLHASHIETLPDGSLWVLASDNGTVSYDGNGKGRPLSAGAHMAAVAKWGDKPLTGNHRRLGLASNLSPIGVVHEGRINNRGQLYLRFTPTDERARDMILADMHEGFSIGVIIRRVEIARGQEVIAEYEPDHLTVAFYPNKPSCPKGTCDVVRASEVSTSTENKTMTQETTEAPAPEAEAQTEMPEAEAPTQEPQVPEAPEAPAADPAPEQPAEAAPEPEATPSNSTADPVPETNATHTPETPAVSTSCAGSETPCDSCASNSTLRDRVAQYEAELATTKAQLQEYEAAERERVLADLPSPPPGADTMTIAELRAFRDYWKQNAAKPSNSTEPEGSGAQQTPVEPPAPEEDPKVKAEREARELWESQKKRYGMI